MIFFRKDNVRNNNNNNNEKKKEREEETNRGEGLAQLLQGHLLVSTDELVIDVRAGHVVVEGDRVADLVEVALDEGDLDAVLDDATALLDVDLSTILETMARTHGEGLILEFFDAEAVFEDADLVGGDVGEALDLDLEFVETGTTGRDDRDGVVEASLFVVPEAHKQVELVDVPLEPLCVGLACLQQQSLFFVFCFSFFVFDDVRMKTKIDEE